MSQENNVRGWPDRKEKKRCLGHGACVDRREDGCPHEKTAISCGKKIICSVGRLGKTKKEQKNAAEVMECVLIYVKMVAR